MFILDYINAAIAKGNIGSYISIGLFALVAIYALLGLFFGAKRGFSKSVIRLFTVGASAVLSLLAVKWLSGFIIDASASATNGGADTIDQVLNSFSPDIVGSMPEAVRMILSEVDSKTATIFAMMIVTVVASPLLFILIFHILKTISFVIYTLLAGLTGAISYGKGFFSTVFGAAVGLAQGVIIAAVMIFPIAGLCNVATEARAPLIEDTEEPNTYVANAYANLIDDLATNPMFELVNKLGGGDLYKDMITVTIDGEKMYMGEKCVGVIKIAADVVPLVDGEFDWKHPNEDERAAIDKIVADIGDDELIGKLVADVMRGMSTAMLEDEIPHGLTGAVDALVDDTMNMFATSTEETIDEDLDVVVDVYFIMCDRNLWDSFNNSEHDVMRDLLTDTDESGKTSADLILERLNEYERSQPIVTSFTKISLSVMHGSENFDEEADALYESVKGGVSDALSHNKSDFETEEEYKEAVQADLDKALEENNINIDASVKENMVDYIAENYGDHEGEITDKEINDALLSYYASYSQAQESGGES